jgi:short-subunit dehydrogenase
MARWRRALVTGASAGIGEAIAKQLASDGVDLVLVARRADRLDALADTMRSSVCRVEVLPADLHDPADLEKVAARVADIESPIDLLVNNAGYGVQGAFTTQPYADAKGQVDLNVVALLRLTHGALERMVNDGRGTIVNVSSVAGMQPGPGYAVYAATKAFVTNYTESLAEELRGSGVSVTAVCPGLTRTEFHAVARASEHTESLPDFVWMSADEVARETLAAAAKGKVVHVTGLGNKVLVGLSAVAPRGVRRRVAGAVTTRRR